LTREKEVDERLFRRFDAPTDGYLQSYVHTCDEQKRKATISFAFILQKADTRARTQILSSRINSSASTILKIAVELFQAVRCSPNFFDKFYML
jgi:hypothetical protein